MSKEKDLRFIDPLYAQSNAGIKVHVMILFVTIIMLFLSAIIWAHFSLIDELTRGNGKVIPSAKIQTIQSLDGGIISEILVSDGTIIKKGQPLLKIDNTRFKASFDENKNTLESLLASKVRILAEVDINTKRKIPKLNFSKYKFNKETISSQKKLFKLYWEELNSNIKTFEIQIKQKQQDIEALKNKKKQLKKLLILTGKELKTIRKLVKQKVKSNIELITIKKEFNQSYSDYMNIDQSIASLKLLIDELNNNIVEKTKMFKSKAAQELQGINKEIKKYESKVIYEEDKLDKTIIISPVNGIIKQININTLGGVIKTGEDLMEIVPFNDLLLIEAKIDPKDIAFINPKQKVIVKVTAYDFSIYGALSGKIVEISADSIQDKSSKEEKTYYKVVIQTDKNYLIKNGIKYPIIPGMITSVDIITGKKSILDFILKPILKTKESALHER